MTNRIDNVLQMKKQTFGVEIEMNGPDNEQACHLVADYFGTSNSCEYEGTYYHKYICLDAKGRTWTFMDDRSPDGDMGCITCEMVTPILVYEDIELLQGIVRMLREHGARSGNHFNAGVHIHVGANVHREGNHLVTDEGGQTPQSIINLVNLCKSHEVLLTNAIRISNDRRGWCKFVNERFLNRINNRRTRPTTWKQLEDAWYETMPDGSRDQHYHDSRYHMLNLHSIFYGHTTCEFRLFEFKTQMHAGELKAWIQLVLAMCSYAKNVRTCSPIPVAIVNEKHAMKSWLTNMGLVGDEFKTCRKMLTKRLSGDTAYAHGRPVADDLDDTHLITND